MPKVHLPDGRVVNFPDSMSPEQITAAIEEVSAPQQAQAAPQPEGKSVSGFLGNVASSGANFVKDTVTGLPTLAKTVAQLPRMLFDQDYAAQQAEGLKGILRAVPQMVGERYGSLEKAGNTLYTDPVGALADVSTVAGLGGAATASRAPRIAARLRAVESATNPVQAITRPAAALADVASDVVIGGTLRPPKAVRDDFGGRRGVSQAVKHERVYSEASAEKKLGASKSKADQMLADAEAAGAPGVPRGDVARSVIGEPQTKAKLRVRLGEPDVSAGLMDTAKGIVRNNPKQIPLTQAQTMKREAQDLAYEAGADNNSVKKSAEKAKAQALRQGIESRVPEVGPVNEQSQRLLGAKKAFENAEDRPRALTNFLSAMGAGGVGVASGDITSGVLMYALMKGMDSPRAGALAGIGINELGRGMNANSMRRAALAARLLGQDQQ